MIAKFILSDDYHLPVFGSVTGNTRYTALFDTGAVIPVFTHGAAKMEKLGGGRDVMVIFEEQTGGYDL